MRFAGSSAPPACRSARPWPPWRAPAGRCTVRVVLDANLLVSAVFGGLPAKAVERAAREELWISPAIQAEWLGLADKISRKLTGDQVTALKARLLALLAGAHRIDAPATVRLCRDPADDAYLSLALAANADVLVTGDDDLLSLSATARNGAGLASLSILSAREFLTATKPAKT